MKAENREEQGEHVQELMSEMTEIFNGIFPEKLVEQGDEAANLNGEGIEKCVMKNLYQDLFRHPAESEFNEKFVK